MKVLIIHTILWSHYKAALFNELATQAGADEVFVVHVAANQGKYQQLSSADRAHHRYRYQVLSEGLIDQVSFTQRVRGLLAAVKTYRPDVINLTGYFEPAYWVLMARYLPAGVKFIISNESGRLDHARTAWKETIKRFIVGRAKGFFCFGKSSADYLLTLGVRPGQILTRHGAVVDNKRLAEAAAAARPVRNTEKQRLGFPEKTLLFVGRLSSEKNLIPFLEAFAAVKNRLPEARPWGMVLLGDGPLRQQLASQYGHLITFLPPVAWTEVPGIMALADGLVLPSLSEPWGLVVNEAMVCGLPVLVSNRCGCVADLVEEGRNGFTFSPDSPAEMETALQNLMQLPETERHRLGGHSKQLIQAFTPQRAAAEMWAGFRKIHHEHS